MELIQLRYFQHLAKSEHLTNTAKEMFITPSAISSSISRLEQELGVCLFDRIGRTMRLNENGRIYLVFIEQLFQILEKANSEISHIKTFNNHSLSVGIRFPYLWQKIFNDFYESHPNVLFSQLTIDMEIHKHEIYKYPVDHFIATSESIVDPAWNSKTIFNDSILLLVSSNHRFANRKEIDLEEIKNENIIGYEGKTNFKKQCDQLFSNAGFTPQYSIFCDLLLINNYIKSGNYIAFSSKFYYLVNYSPKVVGIRIKDTTAELPLALYWKKECENTMASKTFREFLFNYNFEDLRRKFKSRKN